MLDLVNSNCLDYVPGPEKKNLKKIDLYSKWPRNNVLIIRKKKTK